MLVKITKRRKIPIQAVLAIPDLSKPINERGQIDADFYPVDLLLRLRTADFELTGHPYFDLAPICEQDGMPGLMTATLTRSEVNRIRSRLNRGFMVAIGIAEVSKKREEKLRFYFVKSEDTGLSDVDDLWLDNICDCAEIYYKQQTAKNAAHAIGEFAKGLYRVAENRKAKIKPKKPKLKRKERRRLERDLEEYD